MQSAAHGSASRRSGAIGLPQRVHVPYVPASSRERGIDRSSCCVVVVAQREVALLLEHLGGRGRLRAVGHLAGRLDLAWPARRRTRSRSAIEGGAGSMGRLGVHGRSMLPPGGSARGMGARRVSAG